MVQSTTFMCLRWVLQVLYLAIRTQGASFPSALVSVDTVELVFGQNCLYPLIHQDKAAPEVHIYRILSSTQPSLIRFVEVWAIVCRTAQEWLNTIPARFTRTLLCASTDSNSGGRLKWTWIHSFRAPPGEYVSKSLIHPFSPSLCSMAEVTLGRRQRINDALHQGSRKKPYAIILFQNHWWAQILLSTMDAISAGLYIPSVNAQFGTSWRSWPCSFGNSCVSHHAF
jgi:hypothetical protein